MNKVIITTESCADLTEELMNEFGLRTVPMHINFPEKSYDDGQIPVERIYDYYTREKRLPKTSAVNPDEFKRFFESILADNEDADIIHISYSSEASCTFQNACIGIRSMPNVHLVDSKSVSGGLGNLAVKAAQLARDNPGAGWEKVYEMIMGFVGRVKTSFIPGNLDYLVAGGRVSNAAAIGATILRLKPQINIINGKLIAVRKHRGKMSRIAEKYMRDFIAEENFGREIIYILFSLGVEQEVLNKMKVVARELGFKRIELLQTGCVMSTHSGPGAIGLSGITA